MRRKNETEYIDKICSYCGNVSLFQHTPTKRITMFTKTSSWCFKCKRITTQYILNDFDIAYHNLKNLEVLTENEKEVLNIIEGKKNNSKEKKLVLKNEKK
ncbi:MAG: hypothetical protein IK997_04760 [Bacilli bacterium]|nr:hypothetical protein [Bacilli bacterium]